VDFFLDVWAGQSSGSCDAELLAVVHLQSGIVENRKVLSYLFFIAIDMLARPHDN
jgi:hypothetical protein